MSAPFTVEVDTENGDAVVRVAGELDVAVQDDFEAACQLATRSKRAACVVIDLAALTFVDSIGIGLIAYTRRAALAAGKQFRLRNVPARIVEVLQLMGLDMLLGGD